MTCTARDIIKEGRKVRKECQESDEDEIIGNCNFLAKELNERLEKIGCKGAIATGEIGPEPHLTTKHFWIYLRSSQVEGIENGPIFVDPTIDQFSSENANKGIVDIDLGTNLPEIGVFSKKDIEWKYYNP